MIMEFFSFLRIQLGLIVFQIFGFNSPKKLQSEEEKLQKKQEFQYAKFLVLLYWCLARDKSSITFSFLFGEGLEKQEKGSRGSRNGSLIRFALSASTLGCPLFLRFQFGFSKNDFIRNNSVKIQSKCSQNSIKMQPKFSRNAAIMQPKCS